MTAIGSYVRWRSAEIPEDFQWGDFISGHVYTGPGTGPGQPVNDFEQRLSEMKLPEELNIASIETGVTKNLRTGSPLLSQLDDVIINILGSLSPHELKLAARACKTFYRLSKHRVALEASLHRILPDVRLLDKSTFTFDQQFRMICEAVCSPLRKLNADKETCIDTLRILRGPSGFDGMIDATWRCYARLSELYRLPVHTYEEVIQLGQQNPPEDPIDQRVSFIFMKYFEARQKMLLLAGADYNGSESSIVRSTYLGAIQAKFESFNDQAAIEDLIRSKEQQVNL